MLVTHSFWSVLLSPGSFGEQTLPTLLTDWLWEGRVPGLPMSVLFETEKRKILRAIITKWDILIKEYFSATNFT